MKGPREEIVYVACIQPNGVTDGKPDYLATIDVNPKSPTYSKVIHRLYMPNLGDELHSTGWNACSSCFDDATRKRNRLILPGLRSSRVNIVDVEKDPREPTLHKVVDASEMQRIVNCGRPHSVHCLGSGEVMISTLSDAKGKAKGSFILLDEHTYSVKGVWPKDGKWTKFGYDFWYQPRANVMVSSEIADPQAIKDHFDPNDVQAGKFGQSIYFWNWTSRELVQTIDLGPEGLAPLEVKFLHNPEATEGYVGCAVAGNVFRFYKNGDHWSAEPVIKIPIKTVTNWILPTMMGFMDSMVISLDDRFLYFSVWTHGDIRQYDISDPKCPKLVGRIFLGGSLCSDTKVKVIGDSEHQPPPRYIKGRRVEGGPQMLQLSLDGKRLYVTTSVSSSWDKQFYPEMVKKGAVLMQVDVDTDKGGLTLNENFLVDFGTEPHGPVLAHDIRYPGGDSSSDIWN